MDIEASKCKRYSMYQAMCGSEKDIINVIGKENHKNERYYIELLTMLEEKYIRIKRTMPKRIEIEKSEIGEIECIHVDYPKRESEIRIISKKEYTEKEIYFTRYIVTNSKFERKNKYILIIVNNGNKAESIAEIEGVKIKSIGRETLDRISERVRRTEIMEKKILPEFEKYLHLRLGKQLSNMQELRQREFYDFIEYLKTR